MPPKQRKPARPLLLSEDPARAPYPSTAYRARVMAESARISRDPVVLDKAPAREPVADLEDSELSDAERNAAIARERMRREGMI